MRKKWFAALVVQEATHPDEENPRPLFEASLIMLRAVSEEEARRKAEHFGKASEHEYLNAFGKRVAWVFREILDLKEVESGRIADGTEVYYTFLNREELGDMRRALERKDNWP